MIRTKELTKKQAEFIPTLLEWLKQEPDIEYTNGLNRDAQYYISMLNKIYIIGEYTVDEADSLTALTKLYKNG